MSIENINFIHTQSDLLKKITTNTKNAKFIRFYCSNFESYYNNLQNYNIDNLKNNLYSIFCL